jgi:hypothetical protein
MSSSAILLPVFAQVLLTMILLVIMGTRRARALNAGDVKVRDIALSGSTWPDQAKQAANSYANQFEMPVLFYAGVAFALITGHAGGPLVWIAWGFVLSRVVHAYVHVTSNSVTQRFQSFAAGVVMLLALWGVLGFRLLTAGA